MKLVRNGFCFNSVWGLSLNLSRSRARWMEVHTKPMALGFKRISQPVWPMKMNLWWKHIWCTCKDMFAQKMNPVTEKFAPANYSCLWAVEAQDRLESIWGTQRWLREESLSVFDVNICFPIFAHCIFALGLCESWCYPLAPRTIAFTLFRLLCGTSQTIRLHTYVCVWLRCLGRGHRSCWQIASCPGSETQVGSLWEIVI